MAARKYTTLTITLRVPSHDHCIDVVQDLGKEVCITSRDLRLVHTSGVLIGYATREYNSDGTSTVREGSTDSAVELKQRLGVPKAVAAELLEEAGE